MVIRPDDRFSGKPIGPDERFQPDATVLPVTLYSSLRLHKRRGTRAAITLADVGQAVIGGRGLFQASLTFAQIDSAAIVARGGGQASITNQEMAPLE